jgi:Cytochrome bd terminal oxidase subunit I
MSSTTTPVIGQLRQRMIEDMRARTLGRHCQRGHIASCKRFAGYLKRSPDTATADDMRLCRSLSSVSRALREPMRSLVMGLDPVLLSRVQFAFVISFHIIFPAVTIGLAAWLATLEGVGG